jgi:uncharacterized protein YqeY
MLLDTVKTDMLSSLKKGDKRRVETLRFLISAVRNAAISKYGAAGETAVTDEDVLDTVKKQVKQHKESVEAFAAAGRTELAAKEREELEILSAFLPRELSDEELKALVAPIAGSGEQNFGLLMRSAMAAVAGRADGGRVSAMLKTLMQK